MKAKDADLILSNLDRSILVKLDSELVDNMELIREMEKQIPLIFALYSGDITNIVTAAKEVKEILSELDLKLSVWDMRQMLKKRRLLPPVIASRLLSSSFFEFYIVAQLEDVDA